MAKAGEREVRCGACDTKLDEPRNTPPDERQPCPACGSKSRTYPIHVAGTIYAQASLTAEVRIITTPEPAAPKTRELEEYGYTVTWYRYPDGLLLVQVHDEAGNLLDAGGGDDPVDAILEVAEKLLPPT